MGSHNHCGPGTSKNFTKLLEEVNEEYLEFLREKIVEAINVAKNKKIDISHIEYDTYRFDGSVYRRVMKNGVIKMLPNFDVEIDKTVSVIKFIGFDNKTEGIFVHYPCHANVCKGNNLNGDYPRVFLNKIDEKCNVNSLFMQGCTGDIRPKMVVGTEFFGGDFSHVQQYAKQIYNGFLEMLENDNTKRMSLKNIDTNKYEVKLNVNLYKNIEELKELKKNGSELQKQWSTVILNKNNRDYEMLEITKLDLGENLQILFYNAEVSQEYANFASKQSDKTVLSVGYSNGMIAYIPTKVQLAEGGYESDNSTYYFALSGKLKPETEEKVKQKISEILK